MKYNPAIHKRRSIRLKGYDYSQAGLYFITLCVKNRELLFGNIENDEMILNDAGKMIQTEWEKLPQRFGNIELHEFVVMPNHFHSVLEIAAVDEIRAATRAAPTRTAPVDTDPKNDIGEPPVGATLVVAQNDNAVPDETGATPTDTAPTSKTLGEMMGAFKSITTVEYVDGVKNADWQPFDGKLWQRDYYEHVIRNEHSYENIADYIINNPARWRDDKFYCK